MTRIKTKTQTTGLRQEVELLRSFIIGLAGKDKEGNYRPEFVTRVLRATSEKPRYMFTNAKSLLHKLQR